MSAASRFGAALAGGLFTFAAAFAVRLAFLSAGDAVLVIGRQLDRGALAWPLAEIAVFGFGALLAAFAAARRRTPWPARAAGLALFAVYAALVWRQQIRPPRATEFHGIKSVPAGERWRDAHPARPPVEYRANRFGFRGPEFDEKKPEGVLRVALVGDSFVFGQGVEEHETLKARLDEGLRVAGLAGRVEVLNLGLCGNNLPSHLRVYEIARRELSADVVVMGLFVHNDLAEWDYQDELRELSRPSLFSFFAWLLGREPAITLATLVHVQHGHAERSRAALDRLLPRLDALRNTDGAPPLLVLPYHDTDPEVRLRFQGRPNVFLLAPPEAATHYIPGDGHPSAEGNRVYARLVLAALLALPEVRRLAPSPQAPAAP